MKACWVSVTRGAGSVAGLASVAAVPLLWASVVPLVVVVVVALLFAVATAARLAPPETLDPLDVRDELVGVL